MNRVVIVEGLIGLGEGRVPEAKRECLQLCGYVRIEHSLNGLYILLIVYV